MSRSSRHTPICGMTCADSDKEWKRLSHRKLRHAEHMTLQSCADFDALLLPDRRVVSNIYDAPKDGTQFFDPTTWPAGMRK